MSFIVKKFNLVEVDVEQKMADFMNKIRTKAKARTDFNIEMAMSDKYAIIIVEENGK